MLRNSFIGLLLFIVLGVSAWSLFSPSSSWSPHDKKSQQTAETHTQKPDVILEDVQVTVMNKMGQLSFQLSSPKMTHYADNTTQIVRPHILVFRQSPHPWQINAEYAKAKQGIDEFFFWDHVVISHPADKDSPPTEMKTSTLTIFPEKEMASTDQAVVITQPDTTVKAVGMLANLQEGTVKLLSAARGEYVPAS